MIDPFYYIVLNTALMVAGVGMIAVGAIFLAYGYGSMFSKLIRKLFKGK